MKRFKVNEALIPYLEQLHDKKGIKCHRKLIGLETI